MDAAGPTAEGFISYRTMSIVKVAATSVNITAESALALLFLAGATSASQQSLSSTLLPPVSEAADVSFRTSEIFARHEEQVCSHG
jgi:hypothetical protein